MALRMIAAKERGPGPGRYGLPPTCGFGNHDYTKSRYPAYSIGGRLEDQSENYKKKSSPGPVHFPNDKITRSGKDGTPQYSLLARPKQIVPFRTPSPSRYRPEIAHPQGEPHAPVYTMSTRTRSRSLDQNPAPNKYGLPTLLGSALANKTSAPSYSLKKYMIIGSYAEDLCKAPGPGQYKTTHPDLMQHRKPQYSMQSRSKIPTDGLKKPGPGAYQPERVLIHKPQAPKPSLGIRHSEFIMPFIPD